MNLYIPIWIPYILVGLLAILVVFLLVYAIYSLASKVAIWSGDVMAIVMFRSFKKLNMNWTYRQMDSMIMRLKNEDPKKYKQFLEMWKASDNGYPNDDTSFQYNEDSSYTAN